MSLTLRRCFIAFCALAVVAIVTPRPSRGLGVIIQRAQQTVYILVNVTGVAARGHGSTLPGGSQIAARIAMRAKGSEPSVDADVVNDQAMLVAQNQGSVQVRAEITPNPNATLLVASQSNLTFNANAGTTVHQKCIYTVQSNAATISNWTIKQGLANNFTSSWPGTDLSNDSYLQSGTPQPAATPFVVYPSNWTLLAQNSNTKTYCVDLYLTVPAGVQTGSYSTTAVYTLWY